MASHQSGGVSNRDAAAAVCAIKRVCIYGCTQYSDLLCMCVCVFFFCVCVCVGWRRGSEMPRRPSPSSCASPSTGPNAPAATNSRTTDCRTRLAWTRSAAHASHPSSLYVPKHRQSVISICRGPDRCVPEGGCRGADLSQAQMFVPGYWRGLQWTANMAGQS